MYVWKKEQEAKCRFPRVVSSRVGVLSIGRATGGGVHMQWVCGHIFYLAQRKAMVTSRRSRETGPIHAHTAHRLAKRRGTRTGTYLQQEQQQFVRSSVSAVSDRGD